MRKPFAKATTISHWSMIYAGRRRAVGGCRFLADHGQPASYRSSVELVSIRPCSREEFWLHAKSPRRESNGWKANSGVPSPPTRTELESRGYFRVGDHPLGTAAISHDTGVVLFQSDDYFSASVPLFQIADSLRDLPQAVAPVDDRCYLSGRHEVAQDDQVVFARFRQERDQLLAR